VGPFAFIEDGKSNGIVKIEDASCFKVKMTVILTADGKDSLQLEIKRVVDFNTLILGPTGQGIYTRSDLSGYTLNLSPSLKAPEQERKKIPDVDYERAVYEEEPTVAKRSVLVDKLGRSYSENNPFPIKQISDSAKKKWNKIVINRDSDKDIETVVFLNNSEEVRSYSLFYDLDKDLILIEVDKDE
jgi:hypothetical protein